MKIDIHFPHKRSQSLVRQLLRSGLTAADPVAVLSGCVSVKEGILRVASRQFNLKNFQRVVCVGAGKASATMAVRIENLLGSRLEGGVVVVKDGHGKSTKKVQVHEASHPVPDQRSERGARFILQAVQSLGPQDLLIFLLSGGASSLIASPVRGLTLKDKQLTTSLLLRSGATINEVNTVRKHLSKIKGGQLLAYTPASVLALVLSDVIGDDLGTIGSGPMAPDPTSYSDAQTILRKYQVWHDIPARVRDHVRRGVAGKIPETPKPGMKMFSRVHHEIIGNNRGVLEQMAKRAKACGLRPMILTTQLQGEAGDMGRMIAAVAREVHASGYPVRPPACLLWGGELTVKVTGKGNGGRAQELALAAAEGIAGLSNTFVVGFGTDGTDGPTDAAGAMVGGGTLQHAIARHLDPWRALTCHDSYSFFQQAGGHIYTGPTGTNVNDVYMLVLL